MQTGYSREQLETAAEVASTLAAMPDAQRGQAVMQLNAFLAGMQAQERLTPAPRGEPDRT